MSCVAIVALQKDWILEDNSHRVSIYMLISLSLTFSLVVLMADFFECALVCIGLANNPPPRAAFGQPLVSNAMLLFLMLNALSLGMYFGFMYGFKDSQNDPEQTTNLSSMSLLEKAYFAPLSLFLGANAGFWLTMIWANETVSYGDKRRCKYQDGDLGVISFDKWKGE